MIFKYRVLDLRNPNLKGILSIRIWILIFKILTNEKVSVDKSIDQLLNLFQF